MRSLFCGLPHPERRMAVFLSASDENAGKDQRSDFFFGGWLAPENDWSAFLAPAWQEQVLDGPPKIPYLHMTEIRSPAWREKNGLSRLDANDRIDAAIKIIDAMACLHPIGIDVHAGDFRDELKEQKIVVASGAAKDFEPDYLCFLGYAYVVLKYVEKFYPDADKVDFVVERNGDITKHIQEFHSHFAANLEFIGEPGLVKLVGELIPAGKDRIPLQAADVLCWHTGRFRNPETMDADDVRRYGTLVQKKGARVPFTREMLHKLKLSILDASPSGIMRIAP